MKFRFLTIFFPAILLCFPVYGNHSADLIATQPVNELSQKKKLLAPLCWTHKSQPSERAMNHLLTQLPAYMLNDWARTFIEIVKWEELNATLFLAHLWYLSR